MSKIVSFKDDLDGSAEGVDTRTFSIGSKVYQCDLSRDNFEKLEKALARFIKVSRDISPIPRASSTSDLYDGLDLGLVRRWGAENGFDPSPKGRLSATLVQAYKKFITESGDANPPKVEAEEPDDESQQPALSIVP
jgi:hypothetical protein